MGSGELSPTMVKVHRSVLERLGARPVPSLLLDTPFGFQENADELALRVVAYFHESLQTPISIAGMRGTPFAKVSEEGDGRFASEELTTLLRESRYIFAGPGSPTYALNIWRESIVPQFLVEKLTRGGAVCFASAAALTLGAFTVPVYEIYKVGTAPHWESGLDVLSTIGLHVAVIPHYNNAEGGTHDTRFCYLGERRLAMMEEMLPEDAFVLGIDEHTACIIDVDERTVNISGLGELTVRKAGRSVTFAHDSSIPLEALREAAFTLEQSTGTSEAPDPVRVELFSQPAASPLKVIIHDAEEAFDEAIASRNAADAVSTILELLQQVLDWATDIPGQDELERSRASLRSMIVTLGHIGEQGMRDPRELLDPFVTIFIELRAHLRNEGRFDEADTIRNRLASIGIALRDGESGTEWLQEPK
jgi:hypothetical protein